MKTNETKAENIIPCNSGEILGECCGTGDPSVENITWPAGKVTPSGGMWSWPRSVSCCAACAAEINAELED